MKSISQNTQLEVIKQFNEGLPVRTIWKNTGVGVPSIKQIIIDAGIEYNRNKVFRNTEEETLAVGMYNDGKTFTEIAKHFGKSVDATRNTLLKLGVNSRGHVGIDGKHYFNIHDCDHTFFDIIDSEEKAYWLGYLYADGYLYEPTSTLTFTQAEQDSEMVYKFKECLSATYPVLIYDENKTKFYEREISCQKTYRINIKSKQITESLLEKGCMQNKTFKIAFPTKEQVPTKLISHFIRGYFDGDGCFVKSPVKKMYASFSLLGTQHLLEGIQEELFLNARLNLIKIEFADKNNSSVYKLAYSGIGNFKSFYEYLYKNATVYNPRKKNTAESVINLFNERELNKNRILDKKYTEIVKLHNQGKSKTYISKQLNVCKSTVTKAILNN